jgi:virginiamycin B lyase
VRRRSTGLTSIGRFSTGLVSIGLAWLAVALPSCGEDGGEAPDVDYFSGVAPGASGAGSEPPAPGAGGSSSVSEPPSAMGGASNVGSEMPSSEVVTPVGGVSTGGAPALGEPEPSAAGGSRGTIPIIDGPPPPAIAFDEFEAPNPSQPGWITGGPDGQIWFTHQSTAPSAISKVAPQGAPFVRYTTSITNTGPRGITPGPDGNVWYTKQGGIGRMQPDGVSVEFGVPNGGDSAGITLGPDGNLWFTQQLGNRISRVSPTGQFQSFDVPTPSSAPLAITTGDDGNLWFTETAVSANKIGRVRPGGEITEFAIPTPASNPTGITQGPGAELWFTEHDVAKVGKITPDGEITEYYIPSGNRPGRIVAGPDGNLWFTLSAANAIGRITPLGQVSEYPIPTRASDPYDITVGPDNNLWFTELSSNKVGRISGLMGGGNVMAIEGGARGGELGGDTPCNKDTDCIESGRTCGGDVCSSALLCVLAVSGDPGTCATDADCWCQSRGATCTDGQCSFITPEDAP